jgi:hypothetical protein
MRIGRFCAWVSVSAAVVLLGGLAWGSGFEFEARLSGAQEVPAVTTVTTGSLDLEFDESFTTAQFRLKVFDGDDVTQAHLHCHRAGQNGPVVVFLYGLGPTGDVDGLLSQGTLTNASFTGADCVPQIGRPINNLAALAFALRDGLIYANVHTVAHPPGEIRGQLVAEEDCDGDRDDRDHDSDSDSDRGDDHGARSPRGPWSLNPK